jgi:seryl-tRNA synthetase
MNQEKRQIINDLKLQIARAEKVQQRENEILRNLPGLKVSIEVINKKKKELLDSIEKRAQEIEKLTKKMADVEAGNQDIQIESVRLAGKAKNNTHFTQAKQAKKKEEVKQKQKAKQEEKQYFTNREPTKKFSDKDADYFYNRFHQIGEGLPDYMKANLADMPNNKGYIWKGCWFFGEKREEYGAPTTMFEKTREGILYIHEFDGSEHRIYEKVGSERKNLISRLPRK